MVIKSISTALAVVISFGAGIVTNDFVQFRSDFRLHLGSEIQELDAAATKMDVVLAKYFAIAAGDVAADKADPSELRANLLAVQQEARKIADRIPSVDDKYQALDDAISGVISASNSISSPDKNKPFVQSVVRLVEASDDFRKESRELQGSYLTGLPLFQRRTSSGS